jgi:NDP-sugar pyrophosphorylase family protein
MIVAAGLGTRLRPLTALCPKPALPVRGLPLIAYTLALLAHHGVHEVVINTHHLPEQLEDAARRHCPPGLALHFSRETTLLDTGGGIRRVAAFLRESDPCLLIGGDMLVDVDLGALLREHRERRDALTMLLREDPRSAQFGSVGVDAAGCVRRIGSRLDLGGEQRAGIYTWVNVVSRRALDALPQREVFSHLDAWVWPLLQAGARDVRGSFAACAWEPVGTPSEYLAVNLTPQHFAWLDAEARARSLGVRFDAECVVGAGASLGDGASLRRVVVWEGERVPAGLRAQHGVFAGGAFHAVPERASTAPTGSGGAEPA